MVKMRRREEAKAMALELMREHGLIDEGWRFEFHRAVGCLGRCYYRQRKITVADWLVDMNTDEKVRDTILHEIAHALVGAGHKHDAVWKRRAAEIGAVPNACVNEKTIETPDGRYVGTCADCGERFTVYRINKHLMQMVKFHGPCQHKEHGGAVQFFDTKNERFPMIMGPDHRWVAAYHRTRIAQELERLGYGVPVAA